MVNSKCAETERFRSKEKSKGKLRFFAANAYSIDKLSLDHSRSTKTSNLTEKVSKRSEENPLVARTEESRPRHYSDVRPLRFSTKRSLSSFSGLPRTNSSDVPDVNVHVRDTPHDLNMGLKTAAVPTKITSINFNPVVVLEKLPSEEIVRALENGTQKSDPHEQVMPEGLNENVRRRSQLRFPTDDDTSPSWKIRGQASKRALELCNEQGNVKYPMNPKKARTKLQSVHIRAEDWNETRSVPEDFVGVTENGHTPSNSGDMVRIYRDITEDKHGRTFLAIAQNILDSVEACSAFTSIDEERFSPENVLISLKQLQELCYHAVELETMEVPNDSQPEYFYHLIEILEKNIMDGATLLPVLNFNCQDEEDEESQMWLALAAERVTRSSYSSVAALRLLTCKLFSEAIVKEDIIEKIVTFTKFQLQNTVFAALDPAYRLDSKSADGYNHDMTSQNCRLNDTVDKLTKQMYKSFQEIVRLLAKLLETADMTDAVIQQIATVSVSPFFVDGASELQHEALRLVTLVFARYEKHRILILDYMLASIAWLPTRKRSCRSYSLNSGECIQMVTALVLQLIQCMVQLPEAQTRNDLLSAGEKNVRQITEDDKYMTSSFDDARNIATKFVLIFLKRWESKRDEIDYKLLFQHFVEDLLCTFNKPEWPASELLLYVIYQLLICKIKDKNSKMSVKVASLEYLSMIAARLRKDVIRLGHYEKDLNELLHQFSGNDEWQVDPSCSNANGENRSHRIDKIKMLHRVLIKYLASGSESEPALQFASTFYLSLCYRDVSSQTPEYSELKWRSSQQRRSKPLATPSSNKTQDDYIFLLRKKSNAPIKSPQEQDGMEKTVPDSEKIAVDINFAEELRVFLQDLARESRSPEFRLSNNDVIIDYRNAEIISSYLSSKRKHFLCFDRCLFSILESMMTEDCVTVRTKATKCLASVVDVDPSIMEREKLQVAVESRLLDQAISVREAAIDLIGKFVLARPNFISRYYEKFITGTLDVGIIVRKKAIKLLACICLKQPDLPMIPEICIRIVRRFSDVDSAVRKLVAQAFQSFWFSCSPKDKSKKNFFQKVRTIVSVVESCRGDDLELIKKMIVDLIANEPGNSSTLKACRQIVNFLVVNMPKLEWDCSERLADGSPCLATCLGTILLFGEVRPQLVVPHAETIRSYFDKESDSVVLTKVSRILEVIVVAITTTSKPFFARLENDMIQLSIRHPPLHLQRSCVSCLATVINRITRNYILIYNCFRKFLLVLLEYKMNTSILSSTAQMANLRSTLTTVGLFCKYFDLDNLEKIVGDRTPSESLKCIAYETIIHFTSLEDVRVRMAALQSLGFMAMRDSDIMAKPEVKSLYHYLLTSPMSFPVMIRQVLKNICLYLIEEEARMIRNEKLWWERSKSEDLKEVGDAKFSFASSMIQNYLPQMLELVFHEDLTVRTTVLKVSKLVLSQGLVVPMQLVPYIICLGSDDDSVIKRVTSQVLKEIETMYPVFIQMAAVRGVRLSFRLQTVVQKEVPIRGFRYAGCYESCNRSLYSAIKTEKGRTMLLLELLKLFVENSNVSLPELLYIADNIVYFPYAIQDDLMFVLNYIDKTASVFGFSILESFNKSLNVDLHLERKPNQLDGDENLDSINCLLPDDTSKLHEHVAASLRMTLLLLVKQALKEMFGISDKNIREFNVNECRQERLLKSQKQIKFDPKPVITFIVRESLQTNVNSDGEKVSLAHQYLAFKELMLKTDHSRITSYDKDKWMAGPRK